MSLVDLLAQGKIEEFNKRRPVRGKLELFAADLSGADLRGADLSKADLEKADLSSCNLSGVNLVGANLCGVDLTGADLSDAMAMKSRWRDAYVGDANLSGIELAQSDLTDAEFDDCDFNTANLAGARFKRAIFSGCSFREADISEARFNDAQLQQADFTDAYGTNAHFPRADLTGAIFVGANLSHSRLTGVKFNDADLSRTKLYGANLSGADFTNAVLNESDLTRADLTEAVTEAADFTTAVLKDAQLNDHLSLNIQSSIPDAERLLIEEPTLAISGNHIAVLWENPEPSGARLRLAISELGGAPQTPPQPISVPLDLVLGRAVSKSSEGFAVAILVERPSGVSVMLSQWDTTGKKTKSRSFKLGYTPLVLPIMREENGSLMIYGISREGPGLIVQTITEDGIEVVQGIQMDTVRGFVSDAHPVVLSKGGVVTVLKRKGKSPPMVAPKGFPGRRSASTILGRQVVLAWVDKTKAGVCLSVLEPNTAPKDLNIRPKRDEDGPEGALAVNWHDVDQGTAAPSMFAMPDDDERRNRTLPIESVSVGSHKDRAWVGFSVFSSYRHSAWAARLDDSPPIPVLVDQDKDVDMVRIIEDSKRIYMAVTTLDGEITVYALATNGAKQVWSLS